MSRALLDSAELLLQAKNYSGSGNWLDESGNGHDATPVGSPSWDGTKFTLDGVDDGFTIPFSTGLSLINTSWTILVVASSFTTTEKFFISSWNSNAGKGGQELSTRFGLSARSWEASGVASIDTVSGYVANTVVALAGRYDFGAQTLTAIVNGVPSGSPATAVSGNQDNLGLGWAIGARVVLAGFFMPGTFYSAAIWRSALSDADLRSAIRTLRGKDASLLLSGVGG